MLRQEVSSPSRGKTFPDDALRKFSSAQDLERILRTMAGLWPGRQDARAGVYPAQVAVDTLERLFLGAVALGGSTGQQQGIARTGPVARNEWRGLLAGAVAQPTRPTWTMCASASPSGSPRANVMKDCPRPGPSNCVDPAAHRLARWRSACSRCSARRGLADPVGAPGLLFSLTDFTTDLGCGSPQHPDARVLMASVMRDQLGASLLTADAFSTWTRATTKRDSSHFCG